MLLCLNFERKVHPWLVGLDLYVWWFRLGRQQKEITWIKAIPKVSHCKGKLLWSLNAQRGRPGGVIDWCRKEELLTSIDNDFWIRLIHNILPQCFDSRQRVWQEHWPATEEGNLGCVWTLSVALFHEQVAAVSSAILIPLELDWPSFSFFNAPCRRVILCTKSPRSSLSISHSVEQIDLMDA